MKKLTLILGLIISIFFLTGCEINIPDVTTTTTQTTTIKDVIVSIEVLPGNDTVEINSEWIDAGAKIHIDDEVFDMTTEDVVDTSILGLYSITYSYEYNNETYQEIRYVMVVDQTKPVITLNPGRDTINVGDEWIDYGVTIKDNSNEDITVVVNGSVDTNTPGTYQITYTASDSSGNTSQIIRYVTVIE